MLIMVLITKAWTVGSCDTNIGIGVLRVRARSEES